MKHAKPSMTIFADASLMPQKLLGGWGAWARGDGRSSVYLSGKLEFTVRSDVAELYALQLAIARLKASDYLRASDSHIILQSDSVAALQVLRAMPNAWVAKHEDSAEISQAIRIEHSEMNRNPRARPYFNIRQMLQDKEVVYLRHVRGHKGMRAGSRHYINEKVDLLAKAAAEGRSGDDR